MSAFLQYGQAMKGNGSAYYFACAANAPLAINSWNVVRSFFNEERPHLVKSLLLKLLC
jgi:hypothetical protein